MHVQHVGKLLKIEIPSQKDLGEAKESTLLKHILNNSDADALRTKLRNTEKRDIHVTFTKSVTKACYKMAGFYYTNQLINS